MKKKSFFRKKSRIVITLIVEAILIVGIVFSFLIFQKNETQEIPQIENNLSALKQDLNPGSSMAGILPVSSSQKVSAYSVPILMFHYIREYNDPQDSIGVELSVSPQSFQRDLDWLKANNYQSVDFSYFENPVAMDGRPVVLTFDDGYEDAYTAALPLLVQYGFKGVFFIIVNKVGTPGYMSWDEILKMQKAGMIIGSHTLNHPDLTLVNNDQQENEICESKKILEQKLGTAINSFAYPSGKFNANIEDITKKCGYHAAVTTENRAATEKSDPYLLERIRVDNGTNLKNVLAQ